MNCFRSISPTGKRLDHNVGISCCLHGGTQASVSDIHDAVLVTVGINREIDEVRECGTSVRVTMNEPLSDRQVFDAAARAVVPTK